MTEALYAPGRRVAYFSMEIGLDARLPTYSGGLGVLAGDSLRAAADLGIPMCAVTLLYRKGYFRQHLDGMGQQTESPVAWNPEELLKPMAEVIKVRIEGRDVAVRAWQYLIKGEKGHEIPVYFLDSALAENDKKDQVLCDHLYGGDEHYRLCQEAVLGLGGIALLESLGYPPVDDLEGCGKGITVYHMNEGHSALLTLALLRRRLRSDDLSTAATEDLDWVRERTIFTTHTPVPAGHDTFPIKLVSRILGKETAKALERFDVCPEGRLNMSHLAIRFSRYVNGVAKRHGEVSRRLFAGVEIDAITNGIHGVSWTADSIRELLDRYVPGWRGDNTAVRHACEIPIGELLQARRKAKEALFDVVAERTQVGLDPDVFTIGFARRAAEYKRADLLFDDVGKLQSIGEKHPVQIVFAGKAHPKDSGGKAMIRKVFKGVRDLGKSNIKVVYLENYDMELGRLICSGVDLWLNNPVKPLEASGTSGMKAALNGIPSLSTLDGWWVEGCIEDVTGWEIKDAADAFGQAKDDGEHRAEAAEYIYQILQNHIVRGYYENPQWYGAIMRNSMVLNGSFFNTHRMMLQYLIKAYCPVP